MKLLTTILVGTLPLATFAAPLAKPTPQQYTWHEQERIMFICLDPCTWQGREYDNHTTPLDQINPTKLDANQYCRVAKSWGAKQLLLVAKHTGGFCWWQTDTSDYSVKNTPWRGGKGDFVKEVADACRRHGLNFGIYVYPGDDTWGAPMGSGGRTKDPNKQEAYNKVFRQQLTEVLSRYGKITEVWFDGSCVIEVGDIIKKHAPDAVVFQGPHASIRWPGSESGKLPDPAWSSLKTEDLKTGTATVRHDDPDGDAWAPHEADTTLYDHFWFWSPTKEKKRKSLAELMDVYVKSVGRGAVLLLNSTPNTDGLIPDGDVKLYEAFGKEIDRCFGHPIAAGASAELNLGKLTAIDCTMLMEDYRKGHRIREYTIEGFDGNTWLPLATGSAVGRMKIDCFPETLVSKIRLRVTKSAAKPLIRKLAVFRNGLPPTGKTAATSWQRCGAWEAGQTSVSLDLNKFITKPGQYEVRFDPTPRIKSATLLYEGEEATPGMLMKTGNNTFNINRTAQVTGDTSSVLRIEFDGNDHAGTVWIRPRFGE
jgi:alpha-L-fucosidase